MMAGLLTADFHVTARMPRRCCTACDRRLAWGDTVSTFVNRCVAWGIHGLWQVGRDDGGGVAGQAVAGAERRGGWGGLVAGVFPPAPPAAARAQPRGVGPGRPARGVGR